MQSEFKHKRSACIFVVHRSTTYQYICSPYMGRRFQWSALPKRNARKCNVGQYYIISHYYLYKYFRLAVIDIILESIHNTSLVLFLWFFFVICCDFDSLHICLYICAIYIYIYLKMRLKQIIFRIFCKKNAMKIYKTDRFVCNRQNQIRPLCLIWNV